MIEELAYVDIQHDTLAVFDDVQQGIVASEDIWVSAYRNGSTSVHGKGNVSLKEGGGVELVQKVQASGRADGMTIERLSKTHLLVTVPSLNIDKRSIKFPRQVIHPDYIKSSSLDAPLQINTLALNPKSNYLVIGGPDGYCALLSTATESGNGNKGKEVKLKGHVGDVRDVKWFPSGEVILTASSDLSVRVYGKDGINPRTLKGHTRAVTSLHILGVGKQVLSGSKDGTVRMWDVGQGAEVKRWLIGDSSRRGVEGMIVLEPASESATFATDFLALLGTKEGGSDIDTKGEQRVMLLSMQDGVWVQPWEGQGWLVDTSQTGQLVSIAQKDGVIVLGYTNGIVEIRDLSTLARPAPLPTSGSVSTIAPVSESPAEVVKASDTQEDNRGSGRIKRIRRNEASVYSLYLTHPPPASASPSPSDQPQAGLADTLDLYVGTAAGLPCLLRITKTEASFDVRVIEEYGGWDAIGVECWGVVDRAIGAGAEAEVGERKEIWCAGGEGGIRRY